MRAVMHAALGRSAADVFSGRSQRPVINLSASDANTAGSGAVCGSGHIQHAHQRSATDFHRSPARSRSSRRSFSRTTSAVSSLVSASQRRSTTAARATARGRRLRRGHVRVRFGGRRARGPAAVSRCPRATRRSGCCRRQGGDREMSAACWPTVSRARATGARAAPPSDSGRRRRGIAARSAA